MTTIQAIQDELIAAYQAITLPNGLGAPTGHKHEPNGGFTASDLPAVIVTRGVKLTQEPISSGRWRITREWLAEMYLYVIANGDDVQGTERDNSGDCIDAVIEAFSPYDLTTTGVMFHNITADTDGTVLMLRGTNVQIIGVALRHEVTYIQFT